MSAPRKTAWQHWASGRADRVIAAARPHRLQDQNAGSDAGVFLLPVVAVVGCAEVWNSARQRANTAQSRDDDGRCLIGIAGAATAVSRHRQRRPDDRFRMCQPPLLQAGQVTPCAAELLHVRASTKTTTFVPGLKTTPLPTAKMQRAPCGARHCDLHTVQRSGSCRFLCRQCLLIRLVGRLVVGHQHDVLGHLVRALPIARFGHCNACGLIQRIAIDSAADRGERN